MNAVCLFLLMAFLGSLEYAVREIREHRRATKTPRPFGQFRAVPFGYDGYVIARPGATKVTAVVYRSYSKLTRVNFHGAN